jgi:uncharacterized membrane protein YgcG
MKSLKIASLVALLVGVAHGAAALEQQAGAPRQGSVTPGAPPAACFSAASACSQSQGDAAAKLRALLRKHSHGDNAVALATQRLLERNPCAVSVVVNAASNATNAELALQLEQGVVQAEAQLKNTNPAGAQTIQCYLDANRTIPAVAQILIAEGSERSINGGGNGWGNGGGAAGGGGGGGGFVTGGGGAISRH